jgi:hypothetical protein
MDWQDLLNGLQFENYSVFHKEIDLKSRFQLHGRV